MIDWITAIVPCRHIGPIAARRVISLDANGEFEWETEKRLTVEGSYSATVQVKAAGEGLLWVSGNPSKFLQGHNLFGSNDLVRLAYRSFDQLAQKLPIKALLGDRLRWRDYHLKRIDIAECFRLAFGSGLRTGELLALTWKDVDVPMNRVSITKSKTRGRIKSPKTAAGRRVVGRRWP